jgi:hypothetical protein
MEIIDLFMLNILKENVSNHDKLERSLNKLWVDFD